MTDSTIPRSPLPPLVPRWPDCPICHQSVAGDGESWWCTSCGGTWSSNAYDAPGEANPDTEQCPAEVEPYRGDPRLPAISHYRYRCVRDAGHPVRNYLDCHIGLRSDVEGSIDPYDWRDGEHPQWTPAPAAPAGSLA